MEYMELTIQCTSANTSYISEEMEEVITYERETTPKPQNFNSAWMYLLGASATTVNNLTTAIIIFTEWYLHKRYTHLKLFSIPAI